MSKKLLDKKKEASKAAKRRKVKVATKKKIESGIWYKVWLDTFLSNWFPDMDYIPETLGNSIYIGNNIIVTKNSKTALLLITDLGEIAPKSFTSLLTSHLKTKFNDVRVDFSFKSIEYKPNMKSGIDARVEQWNKTLNKENAHEKSKSIARRCIYTVELLNNKVKLFKVRPYIKIRIGKTDKVNAVVNEALDFLEGLGIETRRIKSNMDLHLQYISMVSGKEPQELKDVPCIICSKETLADMTPNTQGLNDSNGTILGSDLLNIQPYIINFRALPGGKGIYVIAPAGEGKTFLVLNWAEEFYVTNYRIAVDDIKGNEFAEFARACGGIVIDLGPRSPMYLNSFKFDKYTDEDETLHTSSRMNLSKITLLSLSKAKKENIIATERLIDKFLVDMYRKLGVSQTNRNTWDRTDHLTPAIILKYFKEYLSDDIKREYGSIATDAYDNIYFYFKETSPFFKEEIIINDLIDSPVLTFAFDIISDTTIQDEALYTIRVMYKSHINQEYIYKNKKKGLWTVCIEEESAIASDAILAEYNKNFILRRSQNVINILLGNSVRALTENKISAGIMDNIQMLCIGSVNNTSRKYLIEEYQLSDKIQANLDKIHDKQTFESTFVLVNKMQKKPINTLLKVFVPNEVKNNPIFKGVDVDE